jgi:hypothetical protein
LNEKGEEESSEYLFDLSDIDPSSIRLAVSGKSKHIKVQVLDGKNYIEVITPEKREFTDELEIYAEEIDNARQIVHTLSFVVSKTVPARPTWNSYSDALGFIQGKIGEVKIAEDLVSNSLEFDASPSGTVDLTIKETDSDGDSEEETFLFYLADMTEKPTLEVSRTRITVQLETRDNHRYIRRLSGGNITGYVSDSEFNVNKIDDARDVINAFAYAIENSEEEIQAFTSAGEINDWMEEIFVPLFRGEEKYEQTMTVDEGADNRVVYMMKLTEEDAEVTETKYEVYPEDLSLGELDITVSSGRLAVSLETEEDDYIRNFKNGTLQNFRDDVKVYFSDPLVAKNFMAAVRYLVQDTIALETKDMGRGDAFSFLAGNIPDIEMAEDSYEQKLEMMDDNNCKVKFTRVETEKDGESDELVYEFTASDIDEGNSELSAVGKLIKIDLETTGNKELIKPYKNGEVDDFEDEFSIYCDDVRLAKKILAAFGALSKECK